MMPVCRVNCVETTAFQVSPDGTIEPASFAWEMQALYVEGLPDVGFIVPDVTNKISYSVAPAG